MSKRKKVRGTYKKRSIHLPIIIVGFVVLAIAVGTYYLESMTKGSAHTGGGSYSTAIISPNVQTISGIQTIEVQASAPYGINKVEIFAEGMQSLVTLTAPPYTTSWDTTTVPDGLKRIWALSWDAPDHWDEAPHMDFRVNNSNQGSSDQDVSPPGVFLAHPADGAIVEAGSIVNIITRMFDRSGQSLDIYVNGQILKSTRYTCSWTNLPGRIFDGHYVFECPWEVPNKPGVTYTIEAKASDTAGHTASSQPIKVTAVSKQSLTPTSAPTEAIKDTTPPVITIISPLDGAVIPRGTSLGIQAKVYEPNGIQWIDTYINGKGNLGCRMVQGDPPEWTYYCNKEKTGGTTTIQVKAVDGVGNAGESQIITVTSSR